MRARGFVVLSGVAAAVVAGCAGAPGTAPADGGTDDATEYGVQATVLQQGEDDPVLCLGGVMESFPPQCGGPTVAGLDWDEVPDAQSASGTTWGTGWLVGTYDGETFTLTEPVAAEPPAWAVPEQPGAEEMFPALCDDPYRGGDESFDPDDEEGFAARDALLLAAEGLDGYATSYVSDGSSAFNVVLASGHDAEAAHAALREVWPGWLCVVERDVPTRADTAAAQEALHSEDAGVEVLGSGTGVDGVLEVSVEVASDDVVAAVHEVVAPWLAPEHVVVHGLLRPVPQG